MLCIDEVHSSPKHISALLISSIHCLADIDSAMTNFDHTSSEKTACVAETEIDMAMCQNTSNTLLVNKFISGVNHTGPGIMKLIENQNGGTLEATPTEMIEDATLAITVIQLDDSEKDPHSPSQVSKKVKMVVHRWGPVEPINPERFFLKMLLSRGYATKMIPALTSQYRRYDRASDTCQHGNSSFNKYADHQAQHLKLTYRLLPTSLPSAKQIQDYDNDLVHAIKNNDLKKVQNLHQSGRRLAHLKCT